MVAHKHGNQIHLKNLGIWFSKNPVTFACQIQLFYLKAQEIKAKMILIIWVYDLVMLKPAGIASKSS